MRVRSLSRQRILQLRQEVVHLPVVAEADHFRLVPSLVDIAPAPRRSAERQAAGSGEADDGAEALGLARQQPWDVFLLDVSMPNRNGIDTLKQLKKEFPRLPVLILSMHPEEQYAVRAQVGVVVDLGKAVGSIGGSVHQGRRVR